MERDRCDAEISQQQCQPLGIVARAAENDEGVAGKFVQDGNQVTVLQRKCTGTLKKIKIKNGFTERRTITELLQRFHIKPRNNL